MKNTNIVKFYIDKHNQYKTMFGTKSFVLMQVGMFHEAYCLENEGPNLHEIGELLDCTVTRQNKHKKEKVSYSNAFLMGVPSHSIEKYIEKLIRLCYIVVIIDQFPARPYPVRKVTGIYSQGTYLDSKKDDTNYVMSLVIEQIKDYRTKQVLLSVGISVIDVLSGKLIIHNVDSTLVDRNLSLDELRSMLHYFNPKEIIINVNNADVDIQHIQQYCELERFNVIDTYHKKEFGSIRFQNNIFKDLFMIESNLSPIEYLDLETYPSMRHSLVTLLCYMKEHNPFMISKLKIPMFYFKQNYLRLGNDIISQLDIIEDIQKHHTKISIKSLFDVINYTKTVMGKRFLRYNMLHPLIEPKEINKRYSLIQTLITENIDISHELKSISDIEKINKKIQLLKCKPKQLCLFMNSICSSYQILLKMQDIFEIKRDTIDRLDQLIQYFDKRFSKDNLQLCNLNDFTHNIYNKNQYTEIDIDESKINESLQELDSICSLFSKLIDSKSQKPLVKLVFTEKTGYYIEITKKRLSILQKNKKNIDFDFDSITLSSIKKGQSYRLVNKRISLLGNTICDHKQNIQDKCSLYYTKDLQFISQEYHHVIEKVIYHIGFIDFCHSGKLLALNNDYVKPKIHIPKNKESFLVVNKMRHPIVEKLIHGEFKPHSFSLGKQQKGMLLYGLNSAGKSTIMKSVGINIILAQMGYFVAATSMTYFPYTHLFCRISSNDNLFKGLSSFHLEINELDSILNRFNERTLVLADEICRGTEHLSAIIIVSAFIHLLEQKGASFISATHLHDLMNVEEIKKNKRIQSYHLKVDCDHKNNRLVYHRTLQKGRGQTEYGLDVARFLMKNKMFIQHANTIQQKMKPKISTKQSRYNKKVYMKQCESCGKIPSKNEIPLETHHIIPQKKANQYGFIHNKKGYHKNKMDNLVVLCQECHDKIDTNEIMIEGHIETSKGYALQSSTISN